MAELTIYGFAPSTYTRSARMACVEAGVAHDLEPLEFKQPSHLALHPFGRMPVLRHGDVVLFETLAIAAYVDDTFGKSRLQPKAALERARMLQWISASIDYVYRDVVGALVKAEQPDDSARATARGHLEVVEGALDAGGYLAGGSLTLADLFLYPMLDYASGKLGPALLEGLPRLSAWRDELAARPSATETAP